jgi:hypothetical protein
MGDDAWISEVKGDVTVETLLPVKFTVAMEG